MNDKPQREYVLTEAEAKRLGLIAEDMQKPPQRRAQAETAAVVPTPHSARTLPGIPGGEPMAEQPETSPAAVAAATGNPAPHEKRITLDVPVTDGAGKRWTEIVLRRPKWSKIEEYSGHHLVQSGKLTANSAIIAACASVPLDFMLDLDGFDGMRLLGAMQDFFPQDLRDKIQSTTSTSEQT